MNHSHKALYGFTLIEGLIVLAVVSISLMVSTPVFSVIEKYRIESNARDVSNAVMYARLLAIKKNKRQFLSAQAKTSKAATKHGLNLSLFTETTMMRRLLTRAMS